MKTTSNFVFTQEEIRALATTRYIMEQIEHHTDCPELWTSKDLENLCELAENSKKVPSGYLNATRLFQSSWFSVEKEG